jgi:hypothetical protein
MFIISRTLFSLVFIFIYVCGEQSDTSSTEKANEVPVQSSSSSAPAQSQQQSADDKTSVKIGSSGFNEFKGNTPVDKSYSPSYISSVNVVGSFGGQLFRSSSVLREAQLQSAASRAEQMYRYAGMK